MHCKIIIITTTTVTIAVKQALNTNSFKMIVFLKNGKNCYQIPFQNA